MSKDQAGSGNVGFAACFHARSVTLWVIFSVHLISLKIREILLLPTIMFTDISRTFTIPSRAGTESYWKISYKTPPCTFDCDPVSLKEVRFIFTDFCKPIVKLLTVSEALNIVKYTPPCVSKKTFLVTFLKFNGNDPIILYHQTDKFCTIFAGNILKPKVSYRTCCFSRECIWVKTGHFEVNTFNSDVNVWTAFSKGKILRSRMMLKPYQVLLFIEITERRNLSFWSKKCIFYVLS